MSSPVDSNCRLAQQLFNSRLTRYSWAAGLTLIHSRRSSLNLWGPNARSASAQPRVAVESGGPDPSEGEQQRRRVGWVAFEDHQRLVEHCDAGQAALRLWNLEFKRLAGRRDGCPRSGDTVEGRRLRLYVGGVVKGYHRVWPAILRR